MELVKKIRQLDSVIDKLPNDFIGEDGKTRKNIDYSFEGTKNSPFQGLKLSHWRTGTKTFYIAYKQNKKSLRYILGMVSSVSLINF